MIDGKLDGKYTKFPSAPTFDNTVAGKTGKEREDAAQRVCDFADMVMRGKKVDEGAPLSKEIGSFQQHNHTFTCHKKRKKCVIYPNEGHSKTKKMTKKEIKDSPKLVYHSCRFNFPKFPIQIPKRMRFQN